MILVSFISCPHCGTAKLESMPTDACQILGVFTVKLFRADRGHLTCRECIARFPGRSPE
jgi:hypothetical protein